MYTTQNGNTIKYHYGSPSQIELYDDTQPTKKLNFDLSQIPLSTTVNLIAPSQSGQIITSGNVDSGFSMLSNSTVTILKSNIKSTSIIVCTYTNTINSLVVEDAGSLYIDSIVPNSSFTVKSTKKNDNNSFYYLIVN